MNNAAKVKLKQFVLSRSFGSGFGLDLMVKDLGIALGIADDNELDVPLSASLVALWRDAGSRLGPGRDHTEIARYTERVAGAELPHA
jgi:3-hydroxyisobutyrate dehydrogenase